MEDAELEKVRAERAARENLSDEQKAGALAMLLVACVAFDGAGEFDWYEWTTRKSYSTADKWEPYEARCGTFWRRLKAAPLWQI